MSRDKVEHLPILVTGGAGYIGAHVCKALSIAGFLPVAFDNLSTGHRSFVKWGPLIEGDVREADKVRDAIESTKAAAVMHFAASAYVGESVVDPLKYFENNVSGTTALLKGMVAAGCLKIVFSSTCAVYGQPDVMPIREHTPTRPINSYGTSKLMAENILEYCRNALGLNYMALRYFNACGADPDGDVGELRDPETHLIPRAMMYLLGHVGDFRIFGSDFDTPDGSAIRDYIHVSDLADAHVAALRLLLGEGGTYTFNLGTGQGHSVRDVLDAISAVSKRTLPALCGARRPGDPAVLVADASYARSELQFEPKLSSLKTIVETAWAWHCRAHS